MPSPTPDPKDVPSPISGAARAYPVRYGFSLEPGEGLEAQEDGDYIRYEDYARLAERLAEADQILHNVTIALRCCSSPTMSAGKLKHEAIKTAALYLSRTGHQLLAAQEGAGQ